VGDLTADDLDILTGDRELLSESLLSVDLKMPLRFESVAEGRMRAGRGTGIIIPPTGTVPIDKSPVRGVLDIGVNLGSV
jgi:hypothetical protein